jgi:DNA-binding NtrC family response regulator
MGGPELARRFRSERPETLVVFMSGYAEGEGTSAGELEDAAAFVQKPYRLDDLSALVGKLLDARGAAGEAA